MNTCKRIIYKYTERSSMVHTEITNHLRIKNAHIHTHTDTYKKPYVFTYFGVFGGSRPKGTLKTFRNTKFFFAIFVKWFLGPLSIRHQDTLLSDICLSNTCPSCTLTLPCGPFPSGEYKEICLWYRCYEHSSYDF